MNFITSIVRKATRKPTDLINILVFVNGFTNRDRLEDSKIYFYTTQVATVDYDLIISDENNLEVAQQCGRANHLLVVKPEIFEKPNLEEIIRDLITIPYLGDV